MAPLHSASSDFGVPQIGQLDLLAKTTLSRWFLQPEFAQCQSPGRPRGPPGAPP